MPRAAKAFRRIQRLGQHLVQSASTAAVPAPGPALEPISFGSGSEAKISVLSGIGFGARVENVDLVHLKEGELEAIQQALRTYKVVVIDGQDHMDAQQLLDFSENWGVAETFDHPTHYQVPNVPGVYIVQPLNKKNKGRPIQYGPGAGSLSGWHADGSRSKNTQVYSFLHAKDVPPQGRDTLFADMEAAYQRLSPSLREWLETLEAVHHWGDTAPPDHPVQKEPPVKHPVIMTDRNTGQKTLYVNPTYTQKIANVRKEESDWLLDFLYKTAHIPELQCRVSWKPGTLVMWDNEKVQHYAVKDQQYDRIMHRTMVWPSGGPDIVA